MLHIQNHNPDEYYNRPEVSNSDLTALKNLLHPHAEFGNKEAAFRIGNLVDAIVTEPDRVDWYMHTVDDVQYSEEDFHFGAELAKSLRSHSRHDPFLAKVLEEADNQCCMISKGHRFTYGEFEFTLDIRCKWDWFMRQYGFGGDLKTTFASSQKEFEEAYDFLDIDRSRAWYMDIAGSDRDFVYAISKKNFRIFKVFIRRDDPIYMRGREKYEELAFQWWCLNI